MTPISSTISIENVLFDSDFSLELKYKENKSCKLTFFFWGSHRRVVSLILSKQIIVSYNIYYILTYVIEKPSMFF